VADKDALDDEGTEVAVVVALHHAVQVQIDCMGISEETSWLE
jgi:hypothetical protein